jgi:antitoxin component of MazEF toxin-antitoxin module
MIQQKLRKVGNSYVVTIPKAEVERQGLAEGQLLGVELTRLDVSPSLSPELQEIFDEVWETHEEGFRYLADR